MYRLQLEENVRIEGNVHVKPANILQKALRHLERNSRFWMSNSSNRSNLPCLLTKSDKPI